MWWNPANKARVEWWWRLLTESTKFTSYAKNPHPLTMLDLPAAIKITDQDVHVNPYEGLSQGGGSEPVGALVFPPLKGSPALSTQLQCYSGFSSTIQSCLKCMGKERQCYGTRWVEFNLSFTYRAFHSLISGDCFSFLCTVSTTKISWHSSANTQTQKFLEEGPQLKLFPLLVK